MTALSGMFPDGTPRDMRQLAAVQAGSTLQKDMPLAGSGAPLPATGRQRLPQVHSEPLYVSFLSSSSRSLPKNSHAAGRQAARQAQSPTTV